MKYFLKTLFVVVIIALIIGYYLKSNGNQNGEIIIGISVLVTAFILMPTFIYYRYKDKKMSNFKLSSKKNAKTL